jgi:mono/diheme cytochrome c family protein
MAVDSVMNPHRRFVVVVVALWVIAGAAMHLRAQESRGSGGVGLSEGAVGGAKGPSGLGRSPTARELAALDISIGPDGSSLPMGSGNATQGALAFTQRACSTCHGPTGKEGPAPVLVGGTGGSEESYYPIVTWPFATMIWDFIHRAMPYDRPGRLTPDEAYALTAFLLFRNGIIQEDDVMDAKSLPKVQMPHRSEYEVPEPWKPGTPRGLQNKVSK